MLREGVAGLSARIVRLGAQADEGLALQGLEFLFREGGVRENAARKAHGGREMLAVGRERKGRTLHAQLREGVVDLVARHRGRAAREHGGREHRDGGVGARLQVAVEEPHLHDDGLAERLLRQQRHLHAARLDELRAGVDVVLIDVEGFGRAAFLTELEALEVLVDGGRGRDVGALELVRRDVAADDAVVAHEVAGGGLVDLGGLHLRDRIAVGEKHAPVAERDVVGKAHGECFGIADLALEHRGLLGLLAFKLLIGHGRPGKGVFDHVDHLRADRTEVLALLDLGAEDHEAGLGARNRPAEDLRGKARLDELLVEAPRRGVGKDRRGHGRGLPVGMQGGGQAVADHEHLRLAGTADRELALAVGGGLDRPLLRKHALGLGDRAEELGDPAKHLVRVEPARNRQHGVVGLVVAAVEGLEVLDLDVLDVASGADRAAAVAVPVEEHGLHALEEHARRTVLAHFILVAHDGHLGVEVLAGDERVDHGVGLPAERPLHVVVRGREGDVVVRAVEPRRAVHAEAALRELGGRIWIVFRPLEHQVFEKVGHAGLAVVLVTRAHEIGHVDRGGRLAHVGIEHDAQAVREPVLGHALDGHDGNGFGCVRQIILLGCRASCGAHHHDGGKQHYFSCKLHNESPLFISCCGSASQTVP